MAALTLAARLNAEAVTSHRRLIKNLRDADGRDAARLADVLEACTDARPCNSGACPLCGRDFQLAAVDLFEKQIKLPAKRDIRGRVDLLTIVPATGCVDPDDLTADVCVRVKSEVTAALVACDLPPALLALDVSFNDDSTGDVLPHWCVHAAGPVYNWLSDNQVKALAARFPKTNSIKRPVHTDHLDKKPNGPLYAFKPKRVRRESYIDPTVEGGRAAHRDSHRRELRPWQRVALALVEHDVGYRGRLINHKIDAVAVNAVLDGFEWARDGP